MKKTPVNASDVFKLLKGKWSVDRIFDNKTNSDFSGAALGETTLKAHNNTLLYNETIKTTFSNGTKAHGKATYKFQIKNNQLHQYLVTQTEKPSKEDHMFTLDFFMHSGKRYAEASYICKKDQYNVLYIFPNDNQFQIIYTVTGPQKDYITRTNFERVALIREEDSTSPEYIFTSDST